MSPKAKSKASPAPADEMSFEQAFAELEQVVEQLEAGELALEESLALFERGQALSTRCQALLEAADLKVQQLAPRGAARGGGYDLEDFEPEGA